MPLAWQVGVVAHSLLGSQYVEQQSEPNAQPVPLPLHGVAQ